MLIEVENLKLAVNGVEILKGVNLRLERGEIYGLLGPNGAGKSSTIAAIMGLYEKSGGKVKLFGERMNGKDNHAVRRKIGVMPENAGFYEWMSAEDYLKWHASLYGFVRPDIGGLLKKVGLSENRTGVIGKFSGGMKQRLALARALLNNPELVILDEPTNGLDPKGRREIHNLLSSLAQSKRIGILLSTHLLDDVDRLCSKIGIINFGRTVIEESLNDLLSTEKAVSKFRVRLSGEPKIGPFPEGAEVLKQEGHWTHINVNSGTKPSELWKSMIEKGWEISEIVREEGGLETLYLKMTNSPKRALN